MRVYVADIRWIVLGIVQRGLHSPERAVTVLRWRSNVVRIA